MTSCKPCHSSGDLYIVIEWMLSVLYIVKMICRFLSDKDTTSDPAGLDISRIKVLLEATLDAQWKRPENELLVYFLNPNVVRLYLSS